MNSKDLSCSMNLKYISIAVTINSSIPKMFLRVSRVQRVMAIDWAYNNLDGSGSHTVVTIATKYSEKIKIIYAKRFDGPRIMIAVTVLNEIAKFCKSILSKDHRY